MYATKLKYMMNYNKQNLTYLDTSLLLLLHPVLHRMQNELLATVLNRHWAMYHTQPLEFIKRLLLQVTKLILLLQPAQKIEESLGQGVWVLAGC
jgi:hypothetical protein